MGVRAGVLDRGGWVLKQRWWRSAKVFEPDVHDVLKDRPIHMDWLRCGYCGSNAAHSSRRRVRRAVARCVCVRVSVSVSVYVWCVCVCVCVCVRVCVCVCVCVCAP